MLLVRELIRELKKQDPNARVIAWSKGRTAAVVNSVTTSRVGESKKRSVSVVVLVLAQK